MKLFADHKGERWFLIPENIELPGGPFVLNTAGGDSVSVAMGFLVEFEHSREEVERYFHEKIQKAAEEGRKAFEALRTVSDHIDPNPYTTDFFARFLGITSEKEKQVFKEGLSLAFQKLDPADFKDLDLAELGINLEIDPLDPEFQQAARFMGPSMETILQDPEAQESLERLFHNVTDQFQGDPEKMKGFIEKMDELNEQIFGEEERKEKEKRGKELRNFARDSIKSALLKRGIKPLSEREE